MKEYHLIITDLILFVLIYFISQAISMIFPGRIKESTTNEGNVRLVESQKSFKHVMVSIYVLSFSIVFLSAEYILEQIVSGASLSKYIKEFFICDELYIDGWIIFWFFALCVYFSEYLIRSIYHKREKTFPISRLLMTIIRSVFFYIAIMWILHFVLKWSPTHMVVSTTVILAIGGYSLKSVTNDLFAGVFLHMSRSLLPSDWVSFPTKNIEGEVLSTNWRETRVRTSGGHIYILPNSFITAQVFHNLSWPNTKRRHNLYFTVNYKSSPDDVEKALLKSAYDQPEILKESKPPKVMIKEFIEYGIKYNLEFWSDTYYSRSSLEGKVNRLAWEEFQRLDIKLPRVLWVYMGTNKK